MHKDSCCLIEDNPPCNEHSSNFCLVGAKYPLHNILLFHLAFNPLNPFFLFQVDSITGTLKAVISASGTLFCFLHRRCATDRKLKQLKISRQTFWKGSGLIQSLRLKTVCINADIPCSENLLQTLQMPGRLYLDIIRNDIQPTPSLPFGQKPQKGWYANCMNGCKPLSIQLLACFCLHDADQTSYCISFTRAESLGFWREGIEDSSESLFHHMKSRMYGGTLVPYCWWSNTRRLTVR